MENNQKERDEKSKLENQGENLELNENLSKNEGEVGVEIEGGNTVGDIVTTNEDKINIKNLTFVSSLTFANLIMEFTRTDKKEKSFETEKPAKIVVDSSIPPPFSPLFNSPSSPSPSSTSLDAKGSAYGVELALLRREGTYMCMCMCTYMCTCVYVHLYAYMLCV